MWLTLGSRCGCSSAHCSLPLVIDHWTLSAHAQPPSSGLHSDWNQPITAQDCEALTNQRLPISSHLASLVPGLRLVLHPLNFISEPMPEPVNETKGLENKAEIIEKHLNEKSLFNLCVYVSKSSLIFLISSLSSSILFFKRQTPKGIGPSKSWHPQYHRSLFD